MNSAVRLLNFSIGFHNVEGLHSDCECFLPDIADSVINDINFIAKCWNCDHDKELTGFQHFYENGFKTPGVKTGRASGGLLLYVRNNISKYVKILKKTPYCIWVEVDKVLFTNLEQNLIVCGQYIPPINSKYYNQNSLDSLNSDIDNFCDNTTPLILVGDLNARTGNLPDNLDVDSDFDNADLQPTEFIERNNCDGIITNQGKNLLNILTGKDLRILNGRTTGDNFGNFTTFKNGSTSVNDYGIVSGNILNKIENFFVLPQSFYSDHSGIVLTIKNKNEPSFEPVDSGSWFPLEKRKKWSAENLSKLNQNLNDVPLDLCKTINDKISNGDIEGASKSLFDLIENALPQADQNSVNSPKIGFPKKLRHKMKKKKTKIWFDKELQDIKSNLNKLSNLRNKFPHNEQIRTDHNDALRDFRKTCKSKKSMFLNKTFDGLNTALHDTENFWKEFRQFSDKRLPNTTITDKISADEWKKYFETLHTENRDQKIPHIVESTPNVELNKPISLEELKHVIKKMKNKKAEGVDKIANEMIKHFPDKILCLILEIFNAFLKSGSVIEDWCLGLITPLFKENSKTDPSNYRGICIANALLKCLCLILNCRLKSFCNENDLVAPEQIGFREKSRTVDHIFTLKTAVNHHLNKKKGNKVYACFIDLRKAYDSIHHKGLFYKLTKMGINGNFLTLLKDIYKKSKCAVKVNGCRTEFFKYTKGVRQGCPLSPLLFNLYINGIVETLNHNNPTPLNMNGNLSCLLYADDLVILSTTKEGLQQSLNSASNFFDEWNLEINHEKSKCMTFNKRGDKGKHLFNIKGNALKNVKTYKYLGVIISSKKCMLSKTLDHLSVKANKALFSLKSNLNLLKMPIKLLLKVYDTMILPILLYGIEVWAPSGKFCFEKWEKTSIEQNHTSLLKQVLGLNRSTKNDMVRAEFGRLPLLYNGHLAVWSYLKYVKKKNEQTLVKKAFQLEMQQNCSAFGSADKAYLNLIKEKIKPSEDPNMVSKKRVKIIFKENYTSNWIINLRNSPVASAYATHKNNYEFEGYLTHVKIKKHRNALAKLRLSDHDLQIQKGRHSRPKTPRHERKCLTCTEYIEDEAHFLLECKDDEKHKLDFIDTIECTYPEITKISGKYLKYKFLMKMNNPEALRSLAFLVNFCFKNRNSKTR